MRVIDLHALPASTPARAAHVPRAFAGQLRQLLCDRNRGANTSLLAAVYPKLRVSRLQPIAWSASNAGDLALRQPRDGVARAASMPFEITVFQNGLAVADLLCDSGTLIPIGEWIEERVTVHPHPLSLRTVIRAVADKGGGAHVDAVPSLELRYVNKGTPGGRTYAEMLVIAIGRFIQRIGEGIFDYRGCRVPVDLVAGSQQKLTLAMVAHEDLAAVLR